MAASSIFEAIPYVTTPLSLVAFLAAAVVIAHARAIGRAEALIKTAPEDDRKTLVGGALQILNLKADTLTREQRFELALETLRQLRQRSLMAFGISMLIAVIFGALAAYSFTEKDPSKTVAELLSGPTKSVAINELKSHGIFEASDRDIVDFLVQRVAIPKEQENSRDEAELVRVASERYNAIASVKELRVRAEDLAEPFKPLGKLLTATVPRERDDEPWQFSVSVPRNSKYSWKTVQVNSIRTGKYIRVLAKPAIDEGSRGTDMFLNKEQSVYLNGGPLIPAKGEFVVRETSESILDGNCSIKGRSNKFKRITTKLCDEGNTVELGYLVSNMDH